MASGHSSYPTSLLAPAVTPENILPSDGQCRMAQLLGKKGTKEDILPARDFKLRKGCCGKAGLRPALLGSKELSVLL